MFSSLSGRKFCYLHCSQCPCWICFYALTFFSIIRAISSTPRPFSALGYLSCCLIDMDGLDFFVFHLLFYRHSYWWKKTPCPDAFFGLKLAWWTDITFGQLTLFVAKPFQTICVQSVLLLTSPMPELIFSLAFRGSSFFRFYFCLFSCSVMFDSLWPHGLQHARLPCPSPYPEACSNPCPLSRWCHPTISSSVIPFSSCLQSFPASGSFPMSRLFASDDQTIGASASASVLPMNIQDWFLLGLTGFISLQPKDSQESSPIPQFESINFSVLRLLYDLALTSIHDYWKNYSFD